MARFLIKYGVSNFYVLIYFINYNRMGFNLYLSYKNFNKLKISSKRESYIMTDNRPRLISKYTEELKRQDRVYQPSVFWENALDAIGRSYASNGIANFRRDKVNLNFFVPTYGTPGNGFEENTIEQIRSDLKPLLNFKQKQALDLIFEGSLQALSDYRTFITGNSVDDIFNNLTLQKVISVILLNILHITGKNTAGRP